MPFIVERRWLIEVDIEKDVFLIGLKVLGGVSIIKFAMTVFTKYTI